MINQENKAGSITCTSLILCPEDRNIKMKGKTTQTAAWTIHASQPFTHLWIDIWYFCQPEQHSCLCTQDAAVLSLTLVGCVPFSAISWVFSAFRMSLSTCSPRKERPRLFGAFFTFCWYYCLFLPKLACTHLWFIAGDANQVITE